MGPAEIPKTDILRGVVMSVVLVAALQTLELLAVAEALAFDEPDLDTVDVSSKQ